MEPIKNLIRQYMNKQVNVICTNGHIVSGKLDDYASESDNEPDGEMVIVNTTKGLVEIYTSEIKDITAA